MTTDSKSLNNIIASVVRVYHWPPEVIGGLFVDRIDYKGILFWFDDAQEYIKELKQ